MVKNADTVEHKLQNPLVHPTSHATTHTRHTALVFNHNNVVQFNAHCSTNIRTSHLLVWTSGRMYGDSHQCSVDILRWNTAPLKMVARQSLTKGPEEVPKQMSTLYSSTVQRKNTGSRDRPPTHPPYPLILQIPVARDATGNIPFTRYV